MKITEIHTYRYEMAGIDYAFANTEVKLLDSTLVEIVTETGLIGYGETCPVGTTYQPEHPLGARAALTEMAPHLLGSDATLIETVRRRMDASLNGHNYAKAAIDMALWDLLGKHRSSRVCDLLGGAIRERVPSYYAFNVGDAASVAEMVREKQDQGFIRLQLKVGGRDIEEDIEIVHRVFEVRKPGVKIVLDANRSWNVRDAIQLSNSCAGMNFVMEQPCATYDEVKSLRPLVRHPIYLDEITTDLNMIMRSIYDGVADGFGMKVTRLGGLTPMRTVRDICKEARRPFSCDDSWGGDIVAAACVHLAATIEPSLSDGVWIAAPYMDRNYDPVNGIQIRNGWIDVPKGPGLGITPDKVGWEEAGSFG